MKDSNRQKDIAESLLLQALNYDQKGDVYNAVKLYKRVIRMSPDWSAPFSYLSLIYKQRKEWRPSLHYSQKAVEFNPFDEVSWQNLAIAATALKKFEIANEAWNQLGFSVQEKQLNWNTFTLPIRINPLSKPEIVWGKSIDPARAIIESIPQPSSGYRHGDLVLVDSKPNGFHYVNGFKRPVFDELQILKRSPHRTFLTFLETDSLEDVKILDDLCLKEGFGFDNWSNAYRLAIKNSQGLPEYFRPIKEEQKDRSHFMVAIAGKKVTDIKKVLNTWKVITLKNFSKVKKIV